MFDPKVNKYPYPLYTDQHYITVKKNNGLVFDKNYPYIDKSKKFLRKQKGIRFLLHLIVFPVTRIKLGLKIKNKKIIKENKELLSKGAISVSNHVHFYDYLALNLAIKPFKPYVLSWARNVTGESSKLVRLVGGIPIPENDFSATVAYLSQVENHLKNGGWLQIYSEGSMWEYYAPIRPFKKGAAHLACCLNKPILPIGYSYRKANWIRRKIFHQPACFTLTIGEPLFPNMELAKEEREIDLTKRSHEAVCLLSGIDPKENKYPPIFDKSKRVDYYTNQYGKK
ncbi:MAG: 1-acyl-sn-glycerol-3-phosphate acyltransferase [Bacilli bacterium]|nr:1-acyl-sn-glycerol-3-phosphate acyltransferase [Bacilli bacterium]